MTTFYGCSTQQTTDYRQSPQHSGTRFENTLATSSGDFSTLAQILWRYITEKREQPVPVAPIPMQTLSHSQLIAENDGSTALYRLGHSSLLLNLAGEFWLIDPVFGERASPVSFAGPRRFHQTPISLDQLPPIRGVIISHDHYDHLDQPTISYLKDQVTQFIMPLGVGNHLRKWGVEDSRITELDWWQHHQLGAVKVTATPARHFSGRGLSDSNQTLWASWVIETGDDKLFYSGDSGYFDGFREIGQRMGPFDLTLMENGAYDRHWSQIHMNPQETLQAHIDLGGKALLPVHNSTFDLAFHSWKEPLQQLTELAAEQQVAVITPIMGQRLTLDTLAEQQQRWWQAL
ncbi:MAG: MBL fold metallo-hydrolase [Marinobacterium sp.]|nr:MBL fold metallo-hydrolase [Marinobacterium sp.]